MDSFSIITDAQQFEQVLLAELSVKGFHVSEWKVDDRPVRNISLPHLQHYKMRIQYANWYTQKFTSDVMAQYDQSDQATINSKKIINACGFSFDYKAGDSYDLLCFLIEVILETIQKNEFIDRVLITEDASGKFYSFNEFYQLWSNNRGFFMRL